jgi:hypothetical protein
MVTKQSIDEQLKKIRFNLHGWGRTEIRELPHIILPDEEIYECVNGLYEGGFALLVATNIRVLLIDKKPLNYLTVEDLRFDMITEMDYSHRLLGARISISAGSKNLKFTSYNQQRLRKLITHVQHCIAENKKKQSNHQEDQNLHLEQINQQLQSYLLAQHQQQERLQEQMRAGASPPAAIEPVRPNPQLSDYLYAQSLLAQHKEQTGKDLTNAWSGNAAGAPAIPSIEQLKQAVQPTATAAMPTPTGRPRPDDLYAEGVQEVFGKRAQALVQSQQAAVAPDEPQEEPADTNRTSNSPLAAPLQMTGNAIQYAMEVNPLRVAYSRLPMAMRNKRFGRPSFHDHSQAGAAEMPDDLSAAQLPAASEALPAHS